MQNFQALRYLLMKNEFYEFEIHENAQDGKFSSREAAM